MQNTVRCVLFPTAGPVGYQSPGPRLVRHSLFDPKHWNGTETLVAGSYQGRSGCWLPQMLLGGFTKKCPFLPTNSVQWHGGTPPQCFPLTALLGEQTSLILFEFGAAVRFLGPNLARISGRKAGNGCIN